MSSSEQVRGDDHVAVVGMGCRLAGGIRSPSALWEFLRNNQDGWCRFGEEPHFAGKGFFHTNKDRPGSMTTEGGFLLTEDVRLFDNTFFGITGRETETLDPSQRKLLEVVYEAFESAGETWDSISGSNTGVYVGNFSFDHLLISARDWEYAKTYTATGAATSILANRLSYIFNLHGPSVVADTACSSSMYALHLAVNAIRNGECDGAVVAAGNWVSDPSTSFMLDKLGALSPTSRSHTFDASADGYARGEGFMAIYLKKTSLALVEGLPIRAVIRGTALNANGRTGGITRPSAKSQEEVIRKAYANAGNLRYSDTAFFECHGTGTQAGDPLEVSAIANVFASSRSNDPEDRLLIGSVKPSLGHTEGASALTSVLKVILALEAGEVPPTYGVKTLNPNIDFEGAKVSVVKDRTVPWPKGKLLRASVNSFGFGGANGHCVLDHVRNVFPDYTAPGISGTRSLGNGTNGNSNGHNGHNGLSNATNGNGIGGGSSSTSLDSDSLREMHQPITTIPKKVASDKALTRQLVLLPFSGHNASSLGLNVDTIAQSAGAFPLADIAYTLSEKRSRLQHRSFRIIDQDHSSDGFAREERSYTAPIQSTNVVFVFTGQGAQWHAMGASLFGYRVFRDTISFLDLVLQLLPERPTWSLSDTIAGNCEKDHIQKPAVSQVACTAIQIALVDLLASWSVRPKAVVGHSSGEMAAAYAAGHATAAEAVTAAYFRGRAISLNNRTGAMLAVGLGADQVFPHLEGREEQVQIAAMNSPRGVTLSGDDDMIQTLAAEFTANGTFNRVLRTSGTAYHSHHMRPLGKEYQAGLEQGLERLRKHGLADESQRYPRIPWVSSVIPDKVMADTFVPAEYWRANLERPVRFTQAVTSIMNAQEESVIDVLVELGPHAALKGPVEQILKSLNSSANYASALKFNENAQYTILQLAGTLFATNAEIDLAAVNAVDSSPFGIDRTLSHGCMAVNLPTYQYTYGPILYHETRASKEYRYRSILRHDLLGSQIPGTSILSPQWRNLLRVKDVPWLDEYRLLPDMVLPAGAFIAMAIEAVTRAYVSSLAEVHVTGYSLRDIKIATALRIPEDDNGVEIVTSLDTPRTTTSELFGWAKFTVVSVSDASTAWTQHCSGFIRLETSSATVSRREDIEIDARQPNPRSWYKKFDEIGLGFGNTFRQLSDLETDPSQHVAKGNVPLSVTGINFHGDESSYTIHPVSFEALFQLAVIAIFGGQTSKATSAFVPVSFQDIYIRVTERPERAHAVARGSIDGPRTAKASVQMLDASGNISLEISSMQFTSFRENHSAGEKEAQRIFDSPFSRSVWKPDIRTLNNKQLRTVFPAPAENWGRAKALEYMELICCLVVVDVYDRVITGTNSPTPKGDLRHWIVWAKELVEKDQRPRMVEARKPSRDQRSQLLKQLYREYSHEPEAVAARLLHENMKDILAEKQTGMDVIVNNNLLTPLYEKGHMFTGSYVQLHNIMDSLGHANPNLRILEIGAGTGAATRIALRALADRNGFKRYANYTFTDISAGFLAAAKEQFAAYRDMHYSVLNIEQDPLENGYEPMYDVVIACEAIHATTSMDKTLAHCRNLLKPGGKMVLVETTQIRVLLGLLYGTFSGYWRMDGRTEGPFMNMETWDLRLRRNGFSGTEFYLDDYEAPHTSTSVLISTRLESDTLISRVPTRISSKVYLVHDGTAAGPLLKEFIAEFAFSAVSCQALPLQMAVDFVPNNSSILLLCAAANLPTSNEQALPAFQHLVKSARSLVWAVIEGSSQHPDPRAAYVTGLLRENDSHSLGNRYLSLTVQEDLISGNADFVRCLAKLQHELLSGTVRNEGLDHELIWKDGCIWVNRVTPDLNLATYLHASRTPTQQGSRLLPLKKTEPLRAAFESPGVPSSVYFVPNMDLLQPIPCDFIDVVIATASIGKKDMNINGYAGVVSTVGSQVRDFAPGDRIFGIAAGHLGNIIRGPAAFAQRLRDKDLFTDAAGVPWAFMTALYAFQYLMVLRRGQTILVQALDRGLTSAVFQIAQYLGAKVFVLVAVSEDVSVLSGRLAVPAHQIIHSNDAGALSRVARSSSIDGFDVILADASCKEILDISANYLGFLGHLIHTGKPCDSKSSLTASEVRQRNTSYSTIDLPTVLKKDPILAGKMMTTIKGLWQTGAVKPLRPLSVISIDNFGKVIQESSHVLGSDCQVISLESPRSLVKVVEYPSIAKFDPEAQYIVVGDLGLLVRSIVGWMVSRGACHVAILSENGAMSAEAKLFCRTLSDRGTDIKDLRCDLSKQAAIVDILGELKSSGRPIKGIAHITVPATSCSFAEMTTEQWRRVQALQVESLLALHESTVQANLDFFVMVVETGGSDGSSGSATSSTAAHFQEQLARYRRRLGLAASHISFGPIQDFQTSSSAQGAGGFTESQVLSAIEPAFLTQSGSSWVGRQADPSSSASILTGLNPTHLADDASLGPVGWNEDARFSMIARAVKDRQQYLSTIDNAAGETTGSTVAQVRQSFDAAVQKGVEAREATIELVTESCVNTIAEMLFIDVENVHRGKSIAEHGVDSLIAVELRLWFQEALNTKMQVSDLLDGQSSISSLAEQIVDTALGA